MNSATRIFAAPLLLLAIGAFVSDGAFAGEFDGRGRPLSGTWDENYYTPSLHVSQYDNPRFFADVWLFENESVERLNYGAKHFYNRLRTRTSCVVGDSLCVEDFTWSVWPTTDGVKESGRYQFESFGARIGHKMATISMIKEDRIYVQSVQDSVEVRLDRETIVVPVNVVVENPRDLTDNDGNQIMERFMDVRIYQALFDDEFLPEDVFTVSHPGESFDQHRVQFAQNPGDEEGLVRIGGFQEIRPDEIWSQCGIQFRLASVVKLTSDTAALKESFDNNGALTSLSNRLFFGQPLPTDHIDVWGDGSVQGVKVAFVPHSTKNGDPGLEFNGLASIGVFDQSSARNAVVSHEIGHALGITGRDEGHPVCDGVTNLMCNKNGWHRHIVGCDQWRDGAERQRQTEICVQEPCEKVSIDLPVGCVPDPGDPPRAAMGCQLARERASGFASQWSGNRAPIVELVDEQGAAFPNEIALECAGELNVSRSISTHDGDTFPESNFRVGGWSVSYRDPVTSEDKVFEYAADQVTIPVDLSLYPGRRLAISFKGYDVQALSAHDGLSILGRRDDEPPTIGDLEELVLDGCAGSGLQVISAPTAVTDNCGEASVAGRIVSLNGVPLDEAIDVSADGNELVLPGRYEVEWIATDAAGNEGVPAVQMVDSEACLAAGSSLRVQNGASLTQENGAPMAMIVLGQGSTLIGGQSLVGSVTSGGPVQVDGGAVVDGDVTSAKSVHVQERTNIKGKVLQNQQLTLPPAPTVPDEFPASCGEAVRYNAGSGQHHLEPGCYSELQLGSRAELVLSSGKYYFKRVSIEPDAILVTPVGLVFDIESQLTFRGKLESPAGGVGYLDLRYRGSGQILVEAPFSGSVLAPGADLLMGGTHGQAFSGKYYARNVEVRSGISVIANAALPGDFGLLAVRSTADTAEVAEPVESAGCAVHARPDDSGLSIIFFSLISAGWLFLRRRVGTNQ